MSSSSGSNSFDPGTSFENGVPSTYIKLGTGFVDSTGAANATFTVPASLEFGAHNVVFKGVKDGRPSTVLVPFTPEGDPAVAASVVSGAGVGAGTAATPRSGVLGALPRTGSQEAVPIAASGIALVVVGAGVVIAARRRCSELDATTSA